MSRSYIAYVQRSDQTDNRQFEKRTRLKSLKVLLHEQNKLSIQIEKLLDLRNQKYNKNHYNQIKSSNQR